MYGIEPYVGRRPLRAMRRGGRGIRRSRPMTARTAGPGIVAGAQRGAFLGLGANANVAIGDTVVLRTTVQKPFQGERLIVSAPSGCIVTDFRVGVTPQLAGNDSAPVEAFAADAVNAEFEIDPAGPGTDIQITIVNNSGAVAAVSAVLVGVRGQ